MRRAALALLAAASGAAGCGGPSGEPPAADSTLVTALIDLHLADARAALDTSGRDGRAVADSLRRLALDAHGLDSAALEARLEAFADDPALARATYDALEQRMGLERQGLTPPNPGDGPLVRRR